MIKDHARKRKCSIIRKTNIFITLSRIKITFGPFLGFIHSTVPALLPNQVYDPHNG